MELKGKKVLFLGDSITQGAGVSSPDKKYTEIFKNISGAEVFNYGISGTRIARQKTASKDPVFDYCFLDRVDKMEEDADVVVIFGGTNDFGHGDASFGDFYSRDEYTYYGALHSLATRLINRYPNSTILFITPLHRTTEDLLINEIGLERHSLKDYVNAMREVCEYYSIPVLDLYKNSGLQPAVEIIKSTYMPDGLHPCDKGAQLIANRIYNFLSVF
jgi:lysophospholipase L1-like esterase